MLPAFPIAATVLAVLDDGSEELREDDLQERFQRSILLASPEIFWEAMEIPDPDDYPFGKRALLEQEEWGKTSDIQRKFIPWLLQRFSSHEPRERLPVDDPTLNLMGTVTRNGRYSRQFFQLLCDHLTEYFKTATDLFDLRDKMIASQPIFDLGYMVNSITHAHNPKVYEHTRGALATPHPDSHDWRTALKYQFDVPVFYESPWYIDRVIGRSCLRNQENVLRRSRGIDTPADLDVVSWDDKHVLAKRPKILEYEATLKIFKPSYEYLDEESAERGEGGAWYIGAPIEARDEPPRDRGGLIRLP